MTPDLSTFAKVRALHDRTDSPGEKASAAAQMRTLARKAGMTVGEAVSKLDAPKPLPGPAPKSAARAAADAFNEFFNSPEMLARNAERHREREARRAEILKRYGSRKAVYAETEREAALRVACKPITVWKRRGDPASCILDGWDSLAFGEKAPPRVREVVAGGWPLPRTVKEAWDEYRFSEERESERQTLHDYEHFPAPWVEVRRHILEDLLDTLPAAGIGDMLTRQSWLEHLNERGFTRDVNRDAVLLATLRADIERMGKRLREQEAAGVQSGQPEGYPPSGYPSRRTGADKRRDVLALLDSGKSDNAPLTDREIARRAGVSPSTVGAIRRACAARPAAT